MTYADLVFHGGPVFTADTVRSRATAVAVRAGRIIAVGHDDVKHLVGPPTEVVDLSGGLLIPGFTDAHAHPVMGGLDRLRCDLSDVGTRPEYLALIKAYADGRPDVRWVTGGGWAMSAFPGGTPRKEDLDAIVPDRPVLLSNRDGHGSWVNSRALELAGIDRETPDPVDGRIERDPDGSPTGTLHEGAVKLVSRLLPATTPEELVEGLLVAQQHLHSLGITSWQDAILGSYGGHDDVSGAYLDVALSGRLTARVVGALWWDRDKGEEQIYDLLERREKLQAPRFRCTSVKIMQDGVAENFTAGMLEPYLDGCGCRTANRGLSFVDPDALRSHVSRLDAEGFQVHFHAIGDRAVREALDAVAVAREVNGWNDHRHHIAHIQVIHPDDIPRFRALGVAANMQPLWAAYEPQMTELTIPFLGEPRSGWQYPFRGLQQAGAVLAGGSDWPVSSANPLWGIHVAVNRMAPPGQEEGEYDTFLPEQRLDLASALAAYTAGSAYLNHHDEGGTIEVGKLADLAVLDRDPFAGPIDEIGSAQVLQTFVEGERVYAS
jgi:predicted amidohydrolase YtcJ